MQTQKGFVSWVNVQAFSAQSQSKCPKKKTFMLPQKYHVSISNVLSKPVKCFMENEN